MLIASLITDCDRRSSHGDCAQDGCPADRMLITSLITSAGARAQDSCPADRSAGGDACTRDAPPRSEISAELRRSRRRRRDGQPLVPRAIRCLDAPRCLPQVIALDCSRLLLIDCSRLLSIALDCSGLRWIALDGPLMAFDGMGTSLSLSLSPRSTASPCSSIRSRRRLPRPPLRCFGRGCRRRSRSRPRRRQVIASDCV